MANADYQKALRLGDREYKHCVSKGIYPYLPVLDDIVSHVEIESQVSLGLVQIPIRSIVGTYSAGRTTAFARNFMPILDVNSEFAAKWGQLFDDLEADGLRDPIKAYEFHNRFYVMEGNKRVSVSKYMDAVSIEANVTRMIPKRNDSLENKIYYEFLDFYEVTGINYLYMSREGNFKRLLNQTYEKAEKWSKDQELEFRAFYTFFEKEFEAKAGDKLSITAGDAACVYLSIYEYEDAMERSQAEIRRDIALLWSEFVNYDSGEEMTLVLNPTPESQKTAFSKLIPMPAAATKIAFIHDKSAQQSAWTYGHELGRKYIEEVFGDKIAVSAVERVGEEEADDVFEAAVEAGNKVIFATSPKLMTPALRAALDHPEVTILNCSMSLNHSTIRSYYLRMYEAKFIIGAIAGAMKTEGNIGYLSDYPIHGTTAEINAFAMGVQMTNPYAKVYLDWSMLKDHDAMTALRHQNVTLFSGRDMNASVQGNREFGLYEMNQPGGPHVNLAMPVRHWGKLYEEIIRSILRGGYKNDATVFGDQALNYFWGMSSDAVDVLYSRNLPAGPVRLLRNLRSGIKSMNLNPFTGPIYDQDGNIRCEDGQELTAKEAVQIDWLAENIVGYIPDITELKEDAVDLVKIQGVKEAAE
ncbi:MAG: BMP family ABC transporter substrate-binding protein [Lachnospiraceae bacterium]|nr:BMP family ABC transporter substrate-binding protein [Lachnospiraceae bacterium]